MPFYTIDGGGNVVTRPSLTAGTGRNLRREIDRERGTITDHVRLGQWAAAARHARQLADQLDLAAKLKLAARG